MNRIEKRSAVAVGDLMRLVFRDSGLAATHNTRRIFAAWNEASGAGDHTIRRFFSKGKLTVTLDSSVLRSLLSLRRDELVREINRILAEDELFIKDYDLVGEVKELVLK